MSRARRSLPAITAAIMSLLLSLAAAAVAFAGDPPGPLPH
jgi:CHASE1-domain containing sensor protein